MKEMPLTQGKVALLDDDDFEWLNQWKWCATKTRNTFYAVRNGPKSEGKKIILMHRVILNTPDGYDCDHKDGNGLNNQKCNLRSLTHRQNLQNFHNEKSSIYPGVGWHKRNKKWKAAIRIKGQKNPKHLGYFKSELEAYQAYCKALESIGETPLPLQL